MSKRRLGRGIDALLQGRDLEQMQSLSSVVSVPIDDLVPSPSQPRKTFSPVALDELAASIREKGVIQPILAEQRDDGKYEIIAGERRFRAARNAGLEVVPVLLRSFTDEEKLEIALIENIQRQDLNPIEEANAYKALLEKTGLNQVELAARLGVNRGTMANAVRLLKLPQYVRERVEEGVVSAGHARALLQTKSEDVLRSLCDRIVNEGISVRLTEQIASGALPLNYADGSGDGSGHPVPADGAEGTDGAEGAAGTDDTHDADSADRKGDRAVSKQSDPSPTPVKPAELLRIEQDLLTTFGTKVTIVGDLEKGQVRIDYCNKKHFEQLYDRLLRSSERVSEP